MVCSTIHKLALRVVTKFSVELGFGIRTRVATRADLEAVVEKTMSECQSARTKAWRDGHEDVESDEEMCSEEVRKVVSRMRRMDKLPQFYAEQDGATKNFHQKYKSRMKDMGLLDLGDLVDLAVLAFQHPVASEWAKHFLSYILVDEFQDCDQRQIDLFRRITGNSITVVGDEDQMIYGWRMVQDGFDNTNPFRIYDHLFANVQVQTLERNYRSPPEIVELSNNLMMCSNSLRSKNTFSMLPSAPDSVCSAIKQSADAEVQWIINKMKQADQPWSNFAVITRLNQVNEYIKHKLNQANIPTKGPKAKKWDPISMMFLNYLKLGFDKRDDKAFLEVYNTPKRGLGEKFKQTIANTIEGPSYFHRTQIFVSTVKARNKMVTAATDFVRLVENIPDGGLAIDAMQYLSQELGDWAIPYALASIAGQMTVEQFITEAKGPRSSCVNVCTVHGAKGMEWHTVFIARVNEGVIPMLREEDCKRLEEERRLLYVAMTRARKRLFISCALEDDRQNKLDPSRFLQDLKLA